MGSGTSKPKGTQIATTVQAAAKLKRKNSRRSKLSRKVSELSVISRRSLGDIRRTNGLEPTLEMVESVEDESIGILHILSGNPNYGYEAKPKIIRIFTSSTFTDTFHERNRLMVDVYPKLKDFCQEYGYQFQVVDMRWGVREESENDHLAVELCMQELKNCQKLSVGPNFVVSSLMFRSHLFSSCIIALHWETPNLQQSFLSHKYGYRPFPRVIPADEFDLLTDEVTEEEEMLIDNWFLLDENLVPPAYVLQPISSHFPNFLSNDAKARSKAKNAWWDVFCKLQNVLVRGAKENLKDPQKIHSYIMSVTERELEGGILNAVETEKHCLWFRRQFTDIEKAPENQQLSRYTEIKSGDSLALNEVKSAFQNLIKIQMPSKLSANRIYNYPIHWDKEKGINPDDPKHLQYLSTLCNDFLLSMKHMIQTGIEKAEKDYCLDSMTSEILEHSIFRHQSTRLFSGRYALLKFVWDALQIFIKFVLEAGHRASCLATDIYWKAVEKLLTILKQPTLEIHDYVSGTNGLPLIIVGGSGCGKTSVLAVVMTESWQWLDGRGAIVYRFLGTTEESSFIKPLLRTLNKQLSSVYNVSDMSKKYYKSEEMKILVQGFTRLLRKASKDKPLVLILDSLDHLDTSDGGRQLEWLPRQLPANVKIILSMRPDEKYGVFPRCKTIFTEPSCYRIVPEFTLSEAKDLIRAFLIMKDRVLTPLQHQCCSSPLYLKLALDESMRWHSYDPPQVTRLYSSISAMVSAFFKRLEKQHGQTLVSFALAFFTAAQNGLSEIEMEDLLSLNDPVLNDVYQYWIPPVRRLPPLLWVRIKSDLESYLSKRSIAGIQVYMWSYRQFSVTCQECYLANTTSNVLCHTLLAEYFMGIWANVPKPYKDKTNQVKEAHRFVAKQPVQFDNKEYNLRKLSQLPYHLVKACKLDFLKRDVVCNYEFLLAKISAVGVSSVLQDLKMAQMAFPTDEDIAIVLETLQLSRHAIQRHPKELAGQLIGRLHINVAANERVLSQAKEMLSAKQLDNDSIPMVATLVEMLEKVILYQNLKYQNLLGLLSQARQSSISVIVPHTACLIKPGGQLLHNLSAHHETINTLTVTSKGNILITGADDNTVKISDVCSGEVLMSCLIDSDIMYISLYPDDSRLVASTIQGSVYVIDVAVGTSILKRDNVGGVNQTNLPLTVCQPNKGSLVVVLVTQKKVITLHYDTLNYITSCDNDLELESKEAGRLMLIQSCKGYVIFVARYSNFVWIVSLKDAKTLIVKKHVAFERPAKVSRHREMISAICLIPDQKQAIICSGQVNDVYLMCLDSGNITTKISGYCRNRILDISYSSKEGLDYFTRKDYVGTLNRKTGERKIRFPHPCTVRKVISCNNRHVITLGEDNIIRIWDKMMHSFSPDVSEFSGKVTVQSRASMNSFVSILDTFADHFDQDAADIKGMLTTEDVKNYWTQDLEHVAFTDDITTRFFQMPSERYLLVTQNGVDPDIASRQFTQCVTIWDLDHLQCVRRFFPPWQTVYIQEVISMDKLLFTDVGKDGSPLYTLDISGKTFKPEMTYNGLETIKMGATVVVLADIKCVIAESSSGNLCLYDIEKGEVTLTLKPQTEPVLIGNFNFSNLKVCLIGNFNFSNLKVCLIGNFNFSNLKLIGGYLIAVHSQRYLCCWCVPSGTIAWQTDLGQHTIGLCDQTQPESSQVITIHNTQDDKYIIVVTDLTKAEGHGKASQSVAVFDLESGNYKSSLNRSPTKEFDYKLTLLRLGKEKLLQLMVLTGTGSAFLLDEVSLGKYPNCHLVNKERTKCVTWCTEDKEEHLVLWKLEGSKLKSLGGFTLDEQLNCVYLLPYDTGSGIIVSTATGLVRLDFSGANVVHSTTTTNPTKDPDYFSHQDLNIKMEIEVAE
ncbi:hypothetical protein LSH36_339g02004 [Paralvinella palmiformis]|uniref:NACHT domain-containing protein n=1 Tax=Paralvinella palmiformis TaxID=53620 RepID=A0AAD9JG36_9ANNE|nr:hypothetical protein LSH36_339g02004 [Paralvinella palmiformis]